MKVLMIVRLSHTAFNEAMRDGSASRKMRRILEETKPEYVYFALEDGRRAVYMIVDVTDPSKIPSLTEPWFLTFDADVEFKLGMTPEDLAKSGLEELGKNWS